MTSGRRLASAGVATAAIVLVAALAITMTAAAAAASQPPASPEPGVNTTLDDGVCPRIVSREEWGARPPKHVEEMPNPMHSVVIHHTYIPGACTTQDECAAAVRAMQDAHQNVRKWDDIGYNFVIGGDGRVYRGRGWNHKGAHCPAYNSDSIGISFIGDWQKEAPPQAMLDVAQWLIRCGVDTGHVSPGYQLLGHRQGRKGTVCPGDALFNVIQGWERWTPRPQPPGGLTALTASTLPDDVPISSGSNNSASGNSRTSSSSASATAVEPDTVNLIPDAVLPRLETVKYDPMPPVGATDAVEVRQLNKRSLWDRLVRIWQQEALRLEREAAKEAS